MYQRHDMIITQGTPKGSGRTTAKLEVDLFTREDSISFQVQFGKLNVCSMWEVEQPVRMLGGKPVLDLKHAGTYFLIKDGSIDQLHTVKDWCDKWLSDNREMVQDLFQMLRKKVMREKRAILRKEIDKLQARIAKITKEYSDVLEKWQLWGEV